MLREEIDNNYKQFAANGNASNDCSPVRSRVALMDVATKLSASRRKVRLANAVIFCAGDLVAFVIAKSTLQLSGESAAIGYAILVVAWLVWNGVFNHSYTRHKPFWTMLKSIYAELLVFCGVGIVFITSLSSAALSLQWLALCGLLVVLLPGARRTSRALLNACGLWEKPTVIFGTGENAVEAYLSFANETSVGYAVKAFVFLAGTNAAAAHSRAAHVPSAHWKGSPEDFVALRNFHCVVAVEADDRLIRDSLIRQLAQYQIQDVHVIPAMRGVPLYGLDTSHFFSHEVLMIHVRNNLAAPMFIALKRCFDIIVSSALLLLLAPVFAYIAYRVTRDGGSAIFSHKRVGQNAKSFPCYKFRSMVINAPELLKQLLASDPIAKAQWDKDFKLSNDPRINAWGQFLRRSSLDELPQLWNVLKGDMSLVGPRPVVQDELERYGEDVAYYLMAKPGMTGLWQVSGRNDVDYDTRVYLDSWYVKNWSLWTDIAILFKTISVVTGRNGAY